MSVSDRTVDPEAPCTCGHLAANHYLRAGVYSECGHCGYVAVDDLFRLAREGPGAGARCPKFKHAPEESLLRTKCPCPCGVELTIVLPSRRIAVTYYPGTDTQGKGKEPAT